VTTDGRAIGANNLEVDEPVQVGHGAGEGLRGLGEELEVDVGGSLTWVMMFLLLLRWLVLLEVVRLQVRLVEGQFQLGMDWEGEGRVHSAA
jgi:hypothetical protein